MTIRDLGYKPYEGARLPPSNNVWVMLRQGLSRAWGSWMVKIAIFLAILPPLIACLVVAGWRYFAAQMGHADEAADIGSTALREMFRYETWFVVSLVTLGAGAAAIAEDLTFKAFQFYLAKPVTRLQYLAGRIAAVAIILFAITFLGGLLIVVIATVTATPDQRVADLGLVAPTLAYSIILALFMAPASVAVSSLSPSRALTMSAWALLFVVPHVIASIVDTISHGSFPWLYLTSFTGLLATIADALFKVEGESALRWYHAAPILFGLALLGVYGAHHRLERVEVIQ